MTIAVTIEAFVTIEAMWVSRTLWQFRIYKWSSLEKKWSHTGVRTNLESCGSKLLYIFTSKNCDSCSRGGTSSAYEVSRTQRTRRRITRTFEHLKPQFWLMEVCIFYHLKWSRGKSTRNVLELNGKNFFANSKLMKTMPRMGKIVVLDS